MKCRNCGLENDENARVCSHCGTTLNDTDQPVPNLDNKASEEGKFLCAHINSRKKDWIIKKLVSKFKMFKPDAEKLYDNLKFEVGKYQLTQEFRRHQANNGILKMLVGPLVAVAGILATIYSFSHSSNGTFYVFYGAPLWGIYNFIMGLIQWGKYHGRITPEGALKKRMSLGSKMAIISGTIVTVLIIAFVLGQPWKTKQITFRPPVVDTGATVSGRVTGENGGPVIGAIVSASSFDTNGNKGGVGTTDSSGNYQIKGLQAGEYRISASSTGKVTLYWSNVDSWSLASPVTVKKGENKAGIDFMLRQGGSISGKVYDSSGQPISGISVAATPTEGTSSLGATTDNNGEYTITNLPLTSYIVTAGPSVNSPGVDKNYATQYYSNKFGSATADQIELSKNTPDIGDINFALVSGGSISGKVYDENNKPLSNAYVWASRFDSNNQEGNGAYSDISGNFIVIGLAPGDYRVSAAFQDKTTQYWQKSVYSSATAVSVTALNVTSNIDFSLESATSSTNATPSSGAGGQIVSVKSDRSSYSLGDTVTIVFEARNTGTATASYLAALDILPPNSSTFVFNQNQPVSLDVGSSGTVTFSWVIPQNAILGKYIVQVSLRSAEKFDIIFDHSWDGASPGTTFSISSN
jgi:uncharacterized repeat protein (TIGR01451 family)